MRRALPLVPLRVLAYAAAPVRLAVRPLDRLVTTLDQSPVSLSAGAVRLRRGLAVAAFVPAGVITVQSLRDGLMVSPWALVMIVLAIAVWTNRGGRFLRDWLPAILAFVCYGLVARAVPDLGLAVHYTPQLDAERALALGSVPTVWLQDRLYEGATGPLELFSLLMYTSHFVAPLLLAALIWLFWQGRGFNDLLFGIVAVSLLAEIAFLVAPTAPPWLAAERGLLPSVDPVIKQTLFDLGLHELAAIKGNSNLYNVVAAVPSLHVAWPVVALLVVRKNRLPRPIFWGQAFILAGVVFSVVYTGEHYLVDGLVGAVFALVAWWLVQRALGLGSASRRPSAVAAGLAGGNRPDADAIRAAVGSGREAGASVLDEGDAKPKVRAREVTKLPSDDFRSH